MGRYYEIWVSKKGRMEKANMRVWGATSQDAKESANKDLLTSGKYKGCNLPRTEAR